MPAGDSWPLATCPRATGERRALAEALGPPWPEPKLAELRRRRRRMQRRSSRASHPAEPRRRCRRWLDGRAAIGGMSREEVGGEEGVGEAAGWKGMEGQRNGGVEVGGAREEARRRRSGGSGRWQQRKRRRRSALQQWRRRKRRRSSPARLRRAAVAAAAAAAKSATERHGPPPHEATIFCFGRAVLIVSWFASVSLS